MDAKDTKIAINTSIYEMLILFFLQSKDCYGYDIYKMLKAGFNNKLNISSNRVYSIIYELRKSGIISEYTKPYGKRARHVYYHLNPIGEVVLNRLLNSYSITINHINSIIYKPDKIEL
ncbi:MAG: PadR family transcriptional regulator [Ruminococcus sp.]|nr:PadR family transcriptional regulator [Ruminococcus sp.]